MDPQRRITEEEISTLVDRFYAKVREDSQIGPVFNDAVHNWAAHLSLLKDFWSTVLLTTGRYKGNPLVAHFQLPIKPEYFDRWLQLFGETAHEVMPAPQAEHVIARASQIGSNIKRVLAYRDQEQPLPITA